MNEKRLAACIGKDGFATQAQASEVAKRGAGSKSQPVSTYRCKWCGRWHVGCKKPVMIKLYKTRKWEDRQREEIE